MNNLIHHLEKKGVPVFGQLIISCMVLNTLIIPFLYKNQDLVYALLIISGIPFITGLYTAFKTHKIIKSPLLILVIGIAFAGLGAGVDYLLYFKIDIPPFIPILLREVGILLIMLFAFLHILMFEKKFNLKGFIIDFILLLISGLFLLLIVSPNLLNTLIYSFNAYQQLLAFNIFISMTVLCMAFIHFFFTKSIGLTDGLRIFILMILTVHFILELVLNFEQGNGNNSLLLNTISLSIFNVSGALGIGFVFIETLSLDYSALPPNRINDLFNWVSSIFAILAIPIGLVIRSTIDAPPIDLLIIGGTSILTSIVVIWRLIVLIKHSNQQKKHLHSLINKNAITGLPNFPGYLEKFTSSDLKNVLVIHMNIEDFKSINDLYGRDAGDEVLRNLALRLKKLPNILLAAHIQSDQFLVAFHTSKSNIKSLIKIIQKDLGAWDIIQGKSIAVPITIGASFSKTFAPEKLAKQAESAFKQARKTHSSFALYTKGQERNQIPRNELRQILQKAVDDNYLPVHFQPIYNLSDGSLKSLELLIRVDSKKHGLLHPRQFLEQAKSYALLTSLTQVCIKMIAKHNHELRDVIVNINLPPYMLKSDKLLENFINSFKGEGLDPKKFCIEITEDEDISAHELTPAIIKLKEQGYTIAMDDFGTGYSSLDRLSVLEIDTVKIDRSILLTSESGNSTILEWAITLAKKIGVSVVVEGVETLEQLSLVKLLGADSVQGFLYSKPVSVHQLSSIPLNSNDIKVD